MKSIFYAGLAGGLGILIFYLIYRRKLKRELKTSLPTKINDALSKYYNKETSGYGGIQ